MKVRVKLIKSKIKETQRVKDTLVTLRLRKISDEAIFDLNGSLLGRLKTVSHLIKIEQI